MLLLTLLTVLDPFNGDFLEELIRKHGDTLYSIAYSFLKDRGKESREDAEDLVQDTFLKVYRHISRFHGISEEETIKLLVIYTKNTVRDYLKKAEHRYGRLPLICENDGDEELLDFPDTAPTPEEIVINEETVRQIAWYIDQLTEDQRQVVLLKYQYGYKNKEIAQVLGISESNVGSRLNRAKAALNKIRKEKINGKGI